MLLLAWLGWLSPALSAEPPLPIRISAPGPRNLSFLPIDLIGRIGADRAEGAEVRVKYEDGGAAVLQDLSQRNVDFGLVGVPAILSQQIAGQKLVVLAAVNDQPLYLLMVRSDLRTQVKSLADLQGRMIGVTASSLTSKTSSEQLAVLLLKSAGVPADLIRVIPAGQRWQEQSAMLRSRTVDAIMSFEPVASRLQAEHLAFVLASLADPEVAGRIPGSGFLLASLATRPDVVEQEPAKVEKMVAILRRVLAWTASHTPEQIVDTLAVKDPGERSALLAALRKYRRLYSPDGRLSARQLEETEIFFHKTHEGNPAAQAVRLAPLVDARWSGRKE